MRRASRASLFVALLAFGAPAFAQEPLPVVPLPPERPPFDVWLAELRQEAIGRGIRPELLDKAFADVQPIEQVLERDRTQAEFTLDLEAYLRRRLTRDTVRTAQQMFTRHRALLRRIEKEYGVDARMLVSIWGLESNFGRFAGVRPTIPTLTTLAYDPRRSGRFRSELLIALEIVNRGDIELHKLRGSWAGALGQPQFLPSSYLKYAQDFDKDGRRDIWSSLPDVFASIAYYLSQYGWKSGATWGREVTSSPAARKTAEGLPMRAQGCRAERLMTEARPVSEWAKLGFKTARKTPLPRSAIPASFVVAGRRSFLVYPNYEALLGYNCAHSYALSVALLADRLK